MVEQSTPKPLWTWDDLVRVSGGIGNGTPTRPITGFSIDTRSLAPGDVFVALKDQRDGHEFVTAAFARGAACALVDARYVRKPGDGALIQGSDTLEMLRNIAIAVRSRLAPTARVIAVTGSAGKTGTTAMLRAALSTAGKTHAPEKSFNNHWGVPLTLARMPEDTEFAVFEIGMNHAGEIRPLTKLVRPHVAIITNVLPVHVGNFPDGEVGVANAKAEIFEGLVEGGVAIIPRDGPHFDLLQRMALAASADVRTFGNAEDATARARRTLHAGSAEDSVTDIQAEVGGRKIRYQLATPGQHIATNSLSVALCLDHLRLLSETALAPLRTIGPSKGRGERTRYATPHGPVLLIDESYNANPASMHWAMILANLEVETPFERGVLVLGDMLELGDGAAKLHGDLGLFIVEALDNIELVFAAGASMKLLFESLPVERRGAWKLQSEALISDVLAAIRGGDVVMVKGSNGSRLAPIVDAIKKHFAGSSGSV